MTVVLVIELHTQGTILVRSTSSPSYLTILYIQTPKQISKKLFLRTVSGFLWLTCWMLKLSLSYTRKNNLYEFCCGLGIKVSCVLVVSAFMATHLVTLYLYIFIKSQQAAPSWRSLKHHYCLYRLSLLPLNTLAKVGFDKLDFNGYA